MKYQKFGTSLIAIGLTSSRLRPSSYDTIVFFLPFELHWLLSHYYASLDLIVIDVMLKEKLLK